MIKRHFHSLVKFTKALNIAAGTTLGITAPTFINFDAHGQDVELPKVDLLGISGFGMAMKEMEVFASWTVSTWDDPDLVRHIDLIDRLGAALDPGKSIPVWDLNGSLVEEVSWMFVTDDVVLDPVDRDDARSYQSISVRLLSGQRGAA